MVDGMSQPVIALELSKKSELNEETFHVVALSFKQDEQPLAQLVYKGDCLGAVRDDALESIDAMIEQLSTHREAVMKYGVVA